MRSFLQLVFLGIVLIVVFQVGSFFYGLQTAQKLSQGVEGYTTDADPLGKTMLVLGDSTALGVGADRPEDSVAGRLATARGIAHVENYAESGARAADIKAQAEKAQRTSYDIILLQVGANDIVRFKPADDVKKDLEPVLQAMHSSSGRAYVMFAGDMGVVPLFPWPLTIAYHQATLRFQDMLHALADSTGVTFVDLYDPPGYNPFAQEPGVYFAKDHFHPSSEGYRLWYEKLKSTL